MPLLKREIDMYPQDLFGRSSQTHSWSVAQVKSRQEKKLARHLLQLGVGFYLPQHEQCIRRSGRNFVSHLPLFPGYVFVRGARDDHLKLWRSGIVLRLVDVPEQQTLAAELEQLAKLQRSGALLIPYPILAIGDSVRITDGAFRGCQGIILREKGRSRLVVSISMLRKAVIVEFSRDALAPSSYAVAAR